MPLRNLTTKSLALVLFLLANTSVSTAIGTEISPDPKSSAENATYSPTPLPTPHVFAPPLVRESQEKQGLVWLNNQKIMFVGFMPDKLDSKGLYIWDTVAGTVTKYSDHTRFCYADGYISALGPTLVRDDPERSTIFRLRYGPLGQEKDVTCDSRSRKKCPGLLNMSCTPAEYPPGSRPLGDKSVLGIQLRDGDGAIVTTTRGSGSEPETSDERKRRRSMPVLLLNKRYPMGKPLPITAVEAIGEQGAAYSFFARRYVFVPGSPINDRSEQSSIWPNGQAQPVYLMTAQGDVDSIAVPRRSDWNRIHAAMPSVPGLVFSGSGAYSNQWGGVFLYDKREVVALDRGYAGPIAVSLDGCKAAYAITNDYGRRQAPNYQRVKLIRFCKGVE